MDWLVVGFRNSNIVGKVWKSKGDERRAVAFHN